jgi:hypothetical protein
MRVEGANLANEICLKVASSDASHLGSTADRSAQAEEAAISDWTYIHSEKMEN